MRSRSRCSRLLDGKDERLFLDASCVSGSCGLRSVRTMEHCFHYRQEIAIARLILSNYTSSIMEDNYPFIISEFATKPLMRGTCIHFLDKS